MAISREDGKALGFGAWVFALFAVLFAFGAFWVAAAALGRSNDAKTDAAKANAGIQFRTKRIPNHHEVSGFQADIGQDYWGALYDESRRKKVLAKPEKDVVAKIATLGTWHTYKIRCEGDRIRLWVDGQATVDYTEADKAIEKDGIIALQVHGGAKTIARYKDIAIVELPAK